MRIAFVFSGQGAQYLGMGKELYETFKESKNIFDDANEMLGFDLKNLTFNGEAEELNITENTQPAILTTSIAALEVLKSKGIEAEIVAGLSLGEYSALVASGAISFKEAVALVKKRGKYMQEAVPLGVGAMTAIMGLSIEKIEEAIDKSKDKGIVQIANYNTGNQIVIGGEVEAVSFASNLCLEYGAKRAINLKVSGPFHTDLLEPASIKLKEEFENIRFNDMKIPVISNVTAERIEKSSDIKELLIKQVKSSVRWRETIERMLDMGIDTFIEIGPGRTLSSFIKEISRNNKVKANIFNVEDVKSLNKTLEGVGNLNA
ncbi:MAG: ACP S-malonyltransferase [Peptostreptococcaceae bacterium]